MKKITLILIYLLNFQAGIAQQGKDGVANITVTSTVNIYTPLTVNAAAGATSIMVASVAGFSAGDLIYIIQMQGATVMDSVYEWGNPNSDLINDTAFGKIRAYNGAGNNEFAEVTSILGNVITIDCALKNSYSDSSGFHPGNTQIIRVPRYISLTLSGAGKITCPSWNGNTGGVVAIEVQNNTIIGSGTSINVTGMGFRGGDVLNATGFSATNTGSSYGTTASNNGAHKGESIAGDTNEYKRYNFNPITGYSPSTPLATCKGNVANGGGGGDAMNCGGGGGSNGGVINIWNGMGNPDNTTLNNATAWSLESTAPVNGTFRPTVSSGGGRGGYSFSSNNADPTSPSNGPNSNAIWGSDSRHNDGGWGGIPLDYSTGKIFFGGGGGAGDENNNSGTAGGNGGGIVYLLSYGTVTGGGQILVDGATALNTNSIGGATHGDDGAGGGGGSGAVFINSTSNITLTNTLSISAQGGIGGSYVMRAGATITDNFGPGGGGGGGYVSTTNIVTGINVNGGANGIVAGASGGSINATKIATKFPPNGATAGGAGTIATFTANFYLIASNYTTCTSSATSLSVTVNGTTPSGLSINWYTVAVGGTPVYSGNPYVITAPSTAGTYTYYAGTCPGIYRIPIIVTVTSAGGPILTVSATNTITCSGASDTLHVSGATSYTWSANAGSATTNTVLINPTNSTTYIVTGATTGACAGTSTASITITVNAIPSITVTATSNTLCSGTSATLTASGANTYSWTPGTGLSTTTTSAVVANPTVTTTYSIAGTTAGCTGTKTSMITVNPTPTITVNAPPVCGGGTDTLKAMGAVTYTWSANAGSVVSNSVIVTPTSSVTIYTVTGTNINNCSSATTATVTTVSNPSVTANSTTVCAGNSATLTATGATNYTWTPSSTLSSATGGTVIATSSVTTTYTITGSVGTCSAVPKVITLTVNPVPSFSVSNSNPIFCQGDSSHLSIVSNTVAATYSWTPSATLNSSTNGTVTATPTTTTIYTVIATATTGGCVSFPQTTTVTVNSIPTLTVSTATICAGGTATLTASGAATYSWNTTATTATITPSPTITTTYTVIGTTSGCSSTKTTIVTVNPIPTLTVSTAAICAGGTATLTASGATTYTWNTLAMTAAITPSPTITTTYTVIGTTNGCSSPATITTISVNPIPTVTISSPAIPNCTGVSTTLTASGATTYSWSPSTGLSSTTGSLTIATPTIVTTYTVIGTANGCPSIPQVYTVTVHTLPHVFITPSATTVCSGSTTTLTVGSGMQFYTWLPSHTSGATLIINPTTTTVYSVTGMDFLGCFSDTSTATVNVIVCTTYSITIPNVFSPNGDGINEVFDVKATGLTSLTCDIYDRWGLKLYTYDTVTGFWDGTHKGSKEPDGTYFYVIQTSDIKGESHKYNGFLELIR